MASVYLQDCAEGVRAVARAATRVLQKYEIKMALRKGWRDGRQEAGLVMARQDAA